MKASASLILCSRSRSHLDTPLSVRTPSHPYPVSHLALESLSLKDPQISPVSFVTPPLSYVAWGALHQTSEIQSTLQAPQLIHPKMAESLSHSDSSRDSQIFTACLVSLHGSSSGPQFPEWSTLSSVSRSFQGFSLHPCTYAQRKYITLLCGFNFLHKRYHPIRVLFAVNGVHLKSFCQDSQTRMLLACSL